MCFCTVDSIQDAQSVGSKRCSTLQDGNYKSCQALSVTIPVYSYFQCVFL